MKKIFMAVALSAAFVAAPAFAETYAGAGIGIANTDSNNTSYKLFAGYQSTQYLGVEVAYNDFGKYRGASGNAWSIAGVGTLPLNKFWNITAKLGATMNHTDLASASRHTDLLTGVGVGYIVAPNMIVRLEYEDFGALPKDASGLSSKANNWGLNAMYSF
jgi:opacity protein-like surface antigen